VTASQKRALGLRLESGAQPIVGPRVRHGEHACGFCRRPVALRTAEPSVVCDLCEDAAGLWLAAEKLRRAERDRRKFRGMR
jgi:hypothetical protein